MSVTLDVMMLGMWLCYELTNNTTTICRLLCLEGPLSNLITVLFVVTNL